ncbi:MAG: tetratricopeptide repeat protein [Candidatus Eisenbacteria bacterium]
MRAERYYAVVVVALSVVVVTSHVLGATVLKGVLWGAHFYGFFPPIVLGVALATTVAAALAIDARLRRTASLTPPARDTAAAARVVVPLVLGALAFVVFWMFRIRHTLLGDSGPLSHNLPLGEQSHPRQPLSLVLHHHVYEWTRRLFEAPGRSPQEVAYDTVALNSVVAGALFVPVAIALARQLVWKPDGADGRAGVTAGMVTSVTAAAALLLAQGYMQLFFGYVENYTWFALAFVLFLWAGLAYLRGRVPLVLASLALAAAIGLNFSGLVLLPSLAVLAAWGILWPATRKAALRDSLATVVIVLGLQTGLAALGGFSATEGFRYMWDLVMRGEATDHTLTYLVSGAHLRDFFSFQLLMGPFAGFLFVPAMLHRLIARRPRDARLLFLLAAALPAFAASWLYGDSIQGIPRDWDLFAPFALLYTAAAIHCIASTPMSPTVTQRLLALATVVSLFHTGAWVAINTSAGRSLERYATLPLSRGRPEMTVGYWYLTHGQKDRARDWFERSVAVYPGNNTAQYQLGLFAMDEGRYEEAVQRFGIATRSRPDKTNYRFALVDALVLARHPEAAAPELERLLTVEPGRADYWGCYGIVLSGLGRAADARAALERAAALAPGDARFAKLIARLGEPDAYARAVREDWDALVVK